jgi:hypothetical protein
MWNPLTLRVPPDETPSVSRMREICTSGLTRGEGRISGPPLLDSLREISVRAGMGTGGAIHATVTALPGLLPDFFRPMNSDSLRSFFLLCESPALTSPKHLASPLRQTSSGCYSG